MDLSIEITTPRGTNDNALAQYFGAVPVDAVSNGMPSWPEADHHHSLNYFNAPPLDPWTDEDANKYVDPNHPMIMDDRELDLLSDHSHSTNTDSDSRGSSNAYSIGSLPSNGHANYSHHDVDWQRFSAGYSHHGQSQLPIAMTSTPSLYGLMDQDHISNPFLLHPSSDVPSPTINPATFHHNVPSSVRPTGQVRAHPHPNSPNVSSCLEERPCVSLSELNAPYIPNTQENFDTELKLLSSSENAINPSSRKRSRSIGIEECDSSITGSSHLPEKTPLDPAGNIRGPRRRTPSFSSSSSSELSDSPPLLKRTRRTSQKVKEELDRVDDDLYDAESDVTDSDIYNPSRSPSVDASQSDYSESISLPLNRAPKKVKKTILKMSAADALAQLSGSASSVMSVDPDREWDLADTRASTSSSSSRRNHSIPIPVPVPHLIKKSRGRKVPYINTRVARGLQEDSTYDGDEDGIVRRGGPSRQGRGRGGGRSGGRSFVCAVEGCGKCFIRGEHLKRHIRSIHTNDKRESFGQNIVFTTDICISPCVPIPWMWKIL
ncbi:hypothetical protein C0992_012168 [Termitomyces sp. T32_za158]|nr:hypothetical protein C0992_012168 [Termitomyces sp. T32_za158]